jgi:ribosomal protein L2, bacterial/organellar
MPVRRFKPTSPGRRHMSVSDFAEVTKSKPEKALTEKLTKKGGRNNTGRITTRHQGGGHKRRYRIIDFKRTKDGVPAKVAAIEYDPNRSARIALLHYADGAKSYILAPAGCVSARTCSPAPTPTSSPATRSAREHPHRHARPQRRAQAGKGGQMARSAGSGIQLVAKDAGYATLRLPSGEMRRVLSPAARRGQVGNVDHGNITAARPAAPAGSASARPCAARR